ncbi:MAG: hypothetical protein LBB91_00395 [Clostridiales bacterium]|nr:hypothetical protein [Clostridiales bacterium]
MENRENNSLLAAVDIGSNTVQMIIAGREAGKIRPIKRFYATTRLGQGMSKGILLKENIEATIQALQDIKSYLELYKPARIRLAATSAVREASNCQYFLTRAADATGLIIEVLNSQEEALLSYLGATKKQNTDHLVLDVGGGSSELIWQEEGRLQTISLPLGAVRAAAAGWKQREIAEQINDLPHLARRQLIGLGGTITTAAGILLGQSSYDREAVDGQVLSCAALEDLEQDLSVLSPQERCRYSPLLAKRGEIMAEGLQIILAIMDTISAQELQVSASGILDGIIYELTIDN